MIISASRRTDIPAFYAPWFFNRLQEGYLLVPNPFDPRTLSRISLGRDVVDCIVFWTKNPAPMLPRLGELSGYNYYFQYTLNPYGADLEKHLPPLEKRIETFKRLSDKVGRDRVVWRYDPILTNAACDVDFHCEALRPGSPMPCGIIRRPACWASSTITAMSAAFSGRSASGPCSGTKSSGWPCRSAGQWRRRLSH